MDCEIGRDEMGDEIVNFADCEIGVGLKLVSLIVKLELSLRMSFVSLMHK